MPAERYLAGHLQGLFIHYIKRPFSFIADVIAAPVGCNCRTVIDLDAVDNSNYLVGRGIDDRDIVSGTVGLDDANRAGRKGQGD